ncbi:MAG: hypothetical protein AB7S70_12435 [Hyphomicrobium sp.]|uniref:hypothetical protein n=1 Tax=Hyphomicrobium sp. TaxID=82 RepID=UPI003D0A37CF
MRASIVTVCLATALALASTLPLARAASAADLDGERYAEPPYDDEQRYGEPDYGDDERYAPPGRYSEAPPQEPPQNRYDQDRYDRERYDGEAYDDRAPGEVPGSIKDGYPVPVPAPRYGEHAPPPERYEERRGERYACLDRWQIRRRLRNDGWEGIRPLGGDEGIVHVRAHRIESGRPFALRVDRCSGEVVDARPERRRAFAYRDWRRDRRW